MRHGYTNDTVRTGDVVSKSYRGPNAATRATVERQALTLLAGRVPLPHVVGDPGGSSLVMNFVSGRHGQELIDDGDGLGVLKACGRILAQLHAVDSTLVFPDSSAGVLVHGDFGPNNVLFGQEGMEVVAVLDWEFCHVGDPIEDLAWCEWIVRTHHPAAVPHCARFFEAYGWTPSWADRKTEMVRRCIQLRDFCREWDPSGPGAAQWADRASQTAAWQD